MRLQSMGFSNVILKRVRGGRFAKLLSPGLDFTDEFISSVRPDLGQYTLHTVAHFYGRRWQRHSGLVIL